MKRYLVERDDHPRDPARPFVVRKDSLLSSVKFYFATEAEAVARAEKLNGAQPSLNQ